MKNIYLLGLSMALLFSGCDDFLDSTNYTGKDDGNFPATETDVNQMVAAVYEATFNEPMRSPDNTYFFWSDLASDDMFGGGGKDDAGMQAFDHLLFNKSTAMEATWTAAYCGIARANSALASIDNLSDEELRNQTKGELLFLRAYNYFILTQAFGNVPLIDKAPANVEEGQVAPAQVDAKEIYKVIASDLYQASQIMPSYPYDGWQKVKYGKVTRWAAEAMLARVFLFYTGFYEQETLPTQDGEITKQQVIDCLNDVIQNSGHKLLSDYRQLWPYTNSETLKDFDKDESFIWKNCSPWKKDGENEEALLSINFMYLPTWIGDKLHLTNQYCLYFGIRNVDTEKGDIFMKDAPNSVYPFGTGWGAGPVATNLVDDWKAAEPKDTLRRAASILDASSYYDFTKSRNAMECTGMFNKKIIAVRSKGGENYSFCASGTYGGDDTQGNYQVSHSQGLILIRYADVLLMQSELTGTADGLNAVRERAGLAPVSYSVEALRNERRWEFAFEGLRWGDLRRWHIAPQALEKQIGQTIYNDGIRTVMKEQVSSYTTRYNATNGFFRIPNAQIELSGGALKQNPGWENQGECSFSSWN